MLIGPTIYMEGYRMHITIKIIYSNLKRISIQLKSVMWEKILFTESSTGSSVLTSIKQVEGMTLFKKPLK